jgi:hypothetical protein
MKKQRGKEVGKLIELAPLISANFDPTKKLLQQLVLEAIHG